MAYNNRNKERHNAHVMAVYNAVKHYDVPDTYIVRCIFPKHNIYISYRTFQSIKNGNGMPAAAKPQLALFN